MKITNIDKKLDAIGPNFFDNHNMIEDQNNTR